MNTPTRLVYRICIPAVALFCAFRLPAATAETTVPPAAVVRIREPAVAGLFYPKDPTELSQVIDA